MNKSLQDIRVNITQETKSSGNATIVQVPKNDINFQLIELLKRYITEIIDNADTIKIWIQLNIPGHETGNTFGVEIQEETGAELSRAEESGYSILESLTKYYISRAKIITKIQKYPDVDDYKMSLYELDEREYTNLKYCFVDLRNNYAVLFDLIVKNLEKIRKPRGGVNLASMYWKHAKQQK